MSDVLTAPAEVVFRPAGRRIASDDHHTLLELAQQCHVPVEQACNGLSACGKCRVHVTGDVSEVTDVERATLGPSELAQGIRLACQTVPTGPVEVTVPSTGPLKILSDGLAIHLRLQPNIRKQVVALPEPTLQDQRDDLARLADAIDGRVGTHFSPGDLRDLANAVRLGKWTVTAVLAGNSLIAVEPGNTQASLYGIAFDIGTTTVVGYLLDLNTGRQVGISATMNPQALYGADVIARIHHTMDSPAGSADLRKSITRGLNHIIQDLCTKAGITPAHVYEVSIVGNTTMLHLLAGAPVDTIACAPYIPVFRQGMTMNVQDLWLKIHPRGLAYLAPGVASYVGADIVGDLLASDLTRKDRIGLLLDFGTNAEIVLGNREKALACSAAAGPCFEGGSISCGMRAASGAISRVDLSEGRLDITTVDNAPPMGLCGTGLVDLVAALRTVGIVDETGRMVGHDEMMDTPPALAARVHDGPKGNRFLLVPAETSGTGEAIYFTQRDVRELQAAKAAIAAGIRLLCAHRGIEREQIQDVLLAGAFGNFMRHDTAIAIGLLPYCPGARYRSIGNAAGVGAQMTLLSTQARRRADKVRDRVEYLELSGIPAFTEAFADEMYIEDPRR